MLAVRFHQFGDPKKVLSLEEVEVPTPDTDEVLVRIKMRTVNPSDLYTVQGTYGVRPPLPAVPGYEAIGTIEALGSGVSGLTVGQRVIIIPNLSFAWQEFAVAKVSQIMPLPDALPDTSAVQLIVNPLTAWAMMLDELKLKAGDTILQTAAASTLGQVLIQLAKLKGIKTINIVRRGEQADFIRSIGGDFAIATDEEDLVEGVNKLTNGQGVTAAVDAVAGETGAKVASVLGYRGTMLIYGVLSMSPLPIDPGAMLFRSTSIRGFWLVDWIKHTAPEIVNQAFAELIGLMIQGVVVPPVEAEYPLKEFMSAIKHSETMGKKGKVLIVS